MFSERNIFVSMHLDIIPSCSGLLPSAGVKLRVKKTRRAYQLFCALFPMLSERFCVGVQQLGWCRECADMSFGVITDYWVPRCIVKPHEYRNGWYNKDQQGCVYIQHQLFHPLLSVLNVDGRLCPLMCPCIFFMPKQFLHVKLNFLHCK